ncbi:TetR/AcrR family transcriptional regulator [Heyndrickxia acidicola]|uniref:TetR/AcrR family transcriptional regulator n=1 Tax=Heyndrickxia acidicola TaxID=209389 RepID=A0ABU6MKX5_9BACI|nr:TetR/AcrR family transcriptional regulator [Heyndrickxia acidicola]MED1205339.1 TetR/AcrR family transcriptional regulator [Heyndrickxia acidicola]
MYRIKNDKRSFQSCQLIYDALAALMKTKSFDTITVQELAAKAQVGRATFYRYFDSLEDVLSMKCDEAFHELKEYLFLYYRQEGAFTETPVPFFKPFLRYWYTHSDIVERLIQAKRMDIFAHSFTQLFTAFSKQLPMSDSAQLISRRFDYFLAIRTGAATNILIQWIQNKKDLPPDELADLVIAQFKATSDIQWL